MDTDKKEKKEEKKKKLKLPTKKESKKKKKDKSSSSRPSSSSSEVSEPKVPDKKEKANDNKKEKANDTTPSKKLKQFDVNAKGMAQAFWGETGEDQLTMPTYGDTESISCFIEQINGNKTVTKNEIEDMMKLNHIPVAAAKNKAERLLKILNHKINDDADM